MSALRQRTLAIPHIVTLRTGERRGHVIRKFLHTVGAVTLATLCLSTTHSVVLRSQAGAAPTISVADVTVVEGSTGTTPADVPVTLSGTSAQPITVAYVLVGGTATAADDYTDASGTVTFAPGETVQTITVSVIGDSADEDDEQFLVRLSLPLNATIANAQAIATIQDDDGTYRRYLAEGATSTFFDTRIALLNPSVAASANVTFRFLRGDGVTLTHGIAVPPLGRRTVDAKSVEGLETAEFSTVIESDLPVVADRTMTWDAQGYGSHAATSIAAPSTTWYLAEGATHSGFALFYLIQNASDAAATVDVTYLLPAALPPILRTYSVPGHSRFTIWVNQEPGLENTDVSAIVTADHPVIVERSMYRDAGGLGFGAGHASAGVTAPTTTWYLAEGATGAFFDMFIPIANPGMDAATVTATFLLPGGRSVVKAYTIAPRSRFNVWVDLEDPQLAETAVSTIVASTNGVPIVVERVMWWPGASTTWTEAHCSPGATAPGRFWGVAGGELGGDRAVETYLLVANPTFIAGSLTVTLVFEDGGQPLPRPYTVAPRSRLDVPVGVDFPAAAGRRFAAIIESTGEPAVPIVVESAMYSNASGVVWAAGSSAPATPLPLPPVPQPPPVDPVVQLLTLDSEHVARVRASLRNGETQYVAALNSLVRVADRALAVEPVSVMEKARTPPSGDKHDYMSQAPYWWPDPSEPDGLPYIRRDGRRNPEVELITDRANLGRMANLVPTLALAYHFTGREAYAAHAAQLVRTWFLDPATRMNPNLNFAQGIPGIADGRAAGLIESRLLPSIFDGVSLLNGSPAWSAADQAALQEWMKAFLTWLIESEPGKTNAAANNNQATWYNVQVVSLAIHTGQTELARSVLERVRSDVGRQFEPDGRQPHELARATAWDYSNFNLGAFLQLASLGERVGVDLWNYQTADGRSLRKGLEYLIPFATGQKAFPFEQITPLRPSLLYPLLLRAATGWNDPRYRQLAQQIGGGTRRLELTFR